MNRRIWFVSLYVSLMTLGLLLTASPAAAQFDTPSRQFHEKTTFRLEGRHLAVACESCHLNGVFRGTPRTCMECHWTRRQDDRFRLALGSQCEQCHTPVSWTSTRFDHGAATGVALGGAHRQLACQACHKNNNFKATNANCVTCHLKDYQRTTNPNHAAGGFPTTCETCHRAGDTSFSQARFDHQAAFPLVGTHLQQVCAACHVNNIYKGTSRDCVGCHRVDYNRTTTPAHAAAGFSTSCDTCHRATDASFKGATFNHAATFALVGVHAQQACATCHKNNLYKGTARDCVGCHRTDYDRTTSPAHAASGMSTVCEGCHRATDPSFRGSTFNHASTFALVGTHAQIACAQCHVNNVFRGTARDCVGCHRTDYNRTTSPNHAAAGYSTTCEQCHRATDTTFKGATFNHAATFALVGVHAQQACAACHINNVYKGTSRDCVGCHRVVYDRTTSPPHAAAGFSTACETCHRATDASFKGATFNHAATFALVGVHAQQACTACHINNVYKGTSRDCVGCHRTKYDRTTAPNHASSGFGTTCETCHRATDSSWTQGTFNHRFPITSGKHRFACAQCHTTPSYQVFTCLTCHGKADMDSKHRNRNGYRYDSLTCYGCHPTGRAG